MRTIDQMVQQEVLCCMSHIVAILANGSGCVDAHSRNAPHDDAAKDLASLAEQALELSMPLPDYEEAAIQDGWEEYRDRFGVQCWRKPRAGESGKVDTWAGTAESLCTEFADLEPYDREVFEHWAVTDWLADKLLEEGEKVDKDFGNLCIWARTTTGQGIASDGVIERVYAKLMQPVEA